MGMLEFFGTIDSPDLFMGSDRFWLAGTAVDENRLLSVADLATGATRRV